MSKTKNIALATASVSRILTTANGLMRLIETAVSEGRDLSDDEMAAIKSARADLVQAYDDA